LRDKTCPFAGLRSQSAPVCRDRSDLRDEGEGCDGLMDEVMKLLPDGEAVLPEDQITDQPERFYASEIVREKAIALTITKCRTRWR